MPPPMTAMGTGVGVDMMSEGWRRLDLELRFRVQLVEDNQVVPLERSWRKWPSGTALRPIDVSLYRGLMA